ncbi:helix-turn-helix domain-containing protein [Nocardia cyriacigeorgica]|uniref:helix-turn-helix domain-containing protein n=1 Tax=Nocardia cyriacigeorgica TaxID=135487 RepID=UPI0018945C5B|nr:helix-turn-helix transcriptional regulator [Nocardia cyriacigeorgica]MBF6084918.1 helix-turn-helix domain-containing protein [Nocardia cyriacigeorgica]MBF6424843.1 helix-turn-helix domain-containing protein [Nocardia cyriacigeorgica]
MKESNSTLPLRELGRQLRDAREGLGMSIERAAGLMEMSASALQRLETGNNSRVSLVVIRELCEMYGLEERHTAALLELASESASEVWLREFEDLIGPGISVFVRLESSAQKLTTYESDLVPGLLQTPDYARALVRAAFPHATAEEQERRVQLKVRRQALCRRRRQPLTLNVLLHEAVLRRVVGNPKIMSTQLKYIADASTKPNISVGIVPFSSGVPLGTQIGPFVILEFGTDRRGKPIEPTTVFTENHIGELYSEKVRTIDRYRQAYAALHEVALDEVDSRALLRRIAKEST